MRFFATILAFFIFSFNLSALNATADGTVREPKVYITQTGRHYHGKDCHYLRSKIAIGLYQAKERGYSACSYCGGEPDGWDYFSDSDYYPIAPNKPNAGNDGNQNEKQESNGNNNEWLGILVFIGIIVFVVVKIKNERNNK